MWNLNIFLLTMWSSLVLSDWWAWYYCHWKIYQWHVIHKRIEHVVSWKIQHVCLCEMATACQLIGQLCYLCITVYNNTLILCQHVIDTWLAMIGYCSPWSLWTQTIRHCMAYTTYSDHRTLIQLLWRNHPTSKSHLSTHNLHWTVC